MEKDQIIAIARIVGSGMLLAFVLGASQSQVVLCIVAYLLTGGDVIYRAVRNIFRGGVFDENLLMTIATIGAFCIGEYPEAVAVMVFYQIGELFSDIAVERSRASISSLMDIRPDYANIEKNGEIQRVSPAEVAAGSEIVVKPGEKIPLDGEVVSGTSALDTAALTGESLPREVAEGDNVISGSMNLTGLLRIRTTGTYGESTVAKILDLVENADTGKTKSEKFITRFARYYTPVVVIGAVLLALLPPLAFGGDWSVWLQRALIFLAISCPCALVVSIPLTFFAGIGCASRKGILVKGSNFLELLSRIRIMVFDKTGTLTRGDFSVAKVCPEEGVSAQELVELSALAEVYSDHPVAASLRNACTAVLDKGRVTDVKNVAGEGVVASVDGVQVYAGNARLMHRAGVRMEESSEIGTIVYVTADGKYKGYIVVSDRVKPQSAEAIKRLKKSGVVKTVMLTGDRNDAAEQVARDLRIDELYAELLPSDKVAAVEKLRDANTDMVIAFAGDGINDAPVLKLADVGIAMGAAGSEAAIEAADVVLMNDNPMSISIGVKIARKTMRIVAQNIVFAIGIKVAMLILGAMGVIGMWAAVFADVGVTVLAVLNALRAMRTK